MSQLPAKPLQSGDHISDVKSLMRWAQAVSAHPDFLLASSNIARLHAVTVKPVTSPFTVQMSDEILLVTVTADHDIVTLPPPVAANLNRISRKYTIIIVGGLGGINLTTPTGKLNFSSSPYYLSGNPGGKVSLLTDGTDYFLA